MGMDGLTMPEIKQVTHGYIGVGATDILDGFSHKSLKEFYPRYCELDIDTDSFEANLREKFEAILASVPPRDQAKILRGVTKMFPVSSCKKPRTAEGHDDLLRAFGKNDRLCTQKPKTHHRATESEERLLDVCEPIQA